MAAGLAWASWAANAQLVDAGSGNQADEFGEQLGVGEHRRGQEAGGVLAGGRVAVVPEGMLVGTRSPSHFGSTA
ncbi:hypothetical protein ACGFR8_36695 [Streptomyces brevispora]|uniref:hypothetical protein n=1 Tax=Streptomyces brevispora TaxID=887462 RepID=UPI003713FB0E